MKLKLFLTIAVSLLYIMPIKSFAFTDCSENSNLWCTQKRKDKQLIAAAGKGNLKLAKALVNNGANVNAQFEFKHPNVYHYTTYPLKSAIGGGHTQLAEFLISNGADIDVTTLELADKRGLNELATSIYQLITKDRDNGVDSFLRKSPAEALNMLCSRPFFTSYRYDYSDIFLAYFSAQLYSELSEGEAHRGPNMNLKLRMFEDFFSEKKRNEARYFCDRTTRNINLARKYRSVDRDNSISNAALLESNRKSPNLMQGPSSPAIN